MHNRVTNIYHQFKSPPVFCVDQALVLPENKIALRADYISDIFAYQKILIIDLISMQPIAALLTDQCHVLSMSLVREDRIAIIYYQKYKETQHLGIWEIDNILAGETNPKFVHNIKISEFLPVFLGLPNGDVAVATKPGNKIDFYSEKQHFFIPYKYSFDHPIQMATTKNELIIANTIELNEINHIQISIVDLSLKKIKETFYPFQHKERLDIDEIIILQNELLCMSYSIYEDDDGNSYKERENFVSVWDLKTKQLKQTLDIKDPVTKLTALPSDDFVTLTEDGGIDYWNAAFERKNTIQLPVKPNSFFEICALENFALLVLSDELLGTKNIFYVTPEKCFLENQNNILHETYDIIAPRTKIPEIKNILRNYLGFFAPKKLCGVDSAISQPSLMH